MKSKKICSLIFACALVFGAIGFTQSQKTTAYAMPSVQVGPRTWHVTGEKDLRDDLRLVNSRCCPDGRQYVKDLINRCIREHRTLVVTQGEIGSNVFYYSIK